MTETERYQAVIDAISKELASYPKMVLQSVNKRGHEHWRPVRMKRSEITRLHSVQRTLRRRIRRIEAGEPAIREGKRK